MRIDFPMPDDEQVRKAVDVFLGTAPEHDPAWRDVVAVMLRGESFSDIERELTQVRREAVIRQMPVQERLTSLVQNRMDPLSAEGPGPDPRCGSPKPSVATTGPRP